MGRVPTAFPGDHIFIIPSAAVQKARQYQERQSPVGSPMARATADQIPGLRGNEKSLSPATCRCPESSHS
ncbi:hypothetical protein AOXY_G24241 [Acipenser oxyrinchus oxyrinchus]|uniref:Uncharacterized protein n=1 Tax=Acipenser oxyrinchus oxyrinchus TaxID=40147 RepID=A0AAD8FXY9_ACIOX|nr:hypothetical protein AOXY_G24241 [Acipenser oxyrinchus oxyrinchus]